MASPHSSIGSEVSVDDSGIILQGLTLDFIPIQPEHIPNLYHLLEDEENVSLFKETYGRTCNSSNDLRFILEYRHIRPQSLTWTIVDKPTREPIGWWVMRTNTDDASTTQAASFLRRRERVERGTECVHYMNPFVFDQLGYRKFEIRAGTQQECSGPTGGLQAMTLVGILSRQLQDLSRSQHSDLYVLTREQWPALSEAVQAWLDAKMVCKTQQSTETSFATHYDLLK
ncbi:uncharacterized protein LTR77_006954 [Saxophila tyrrhenica]|uniref:N-acetyltransferase domain-containing protein n=1 Tax=Saxophila tyrrhenica TaxID=1690608 RepID=A0AAV9P702_9PEZI|nr:hypothetical protein LTR77_006954 [Saxophila tyrrhenica]